MQGHDTMLRGIREPTSLQGHVEGLCLAGAPSGPAPYPY
jgi:hypothetical protein